MTPDTMLALVREYAAAKSAQDVPRTLAVCDDAFELETIAFGTRSRGHAETAAHLQAFFATFPDYGVVVERLVADDGVVACWGTATMSMHGPILDIAPTGRTARVPFMCVFGFRGERIALERFFFDLASLCRQLGVSADRVDAALASFRESGHGEAHP